MKQATGLALLVVCYVAIIVPFSSLLVHRPLEVRLGVPPDARLLKSVTADQRYAVADWLIVRVLFYFGTLMEQDRRVVSPKPEYYNMFKTLETALKLDPYNMDAYYFMQAAFTWEIGRANDVNRVLAYGMKHRVWDYQLPFYAGFNAAYFLKDYKAAALYMRRAAELSGEPLFINLAARYFYEAGENELGLIFLDSMMKGVRDPGVKKVFALRKAALEAVRKIQQVIADYRLANGGKIPDNIDELVATGFLDKVPVDPYGGTFYLDQDGKVRSTSKFSSAVKR